MHPPTWVCPPNLDLPISRWPSLILCSFNCCIWGDILSFCCLCVCSVHPKTTVVVSVHLNVRYVECAASPHLPPSSPPFLFSTLSEHVLDQIKGRNNFIGLIFFLVYSIIIPVKSKFVPFCRFTSFPHPFIHPFFPSLLSPGAVSCRSGTSRLTCSGR